MVPCYAAQSQGNNSKEHLKSTKMSIDSSKSIGYGKIHKRMLEKVYFILTLAKERRVWTGTSHEIPMSG